MEVVGLLASETGCTFGFGMFQTMFTPNLLRQVAGLVYQPTGEILPADLPGAFYMGIRQPVGVVAGLAPWNAPLILSLRSIAAALAFGNTVVLKPSEESPHHGRHPLRGDLRGGRLPTRGRQRRDARARPGGAGRR